MVAGVRFGFGTVPSSSSSPVAGAARPQQNRLSLLSADAERNEVTAPVFGRLPCGYGDGMSRLSNRGGPVLREPSPAPQQSSAYSQGHDCACCQHECPWQADGDMLGPRAQGQPYENSYRGAHHKHFPPAARVWLCGMRIVPSDDGGHLLGVKTVAIALAVHGNLPVHQFRVSWIGQTDGDSA